MAPISHWALCALLLPFSAFASPPADENLVVIRRDSSPNHSKLPTAVIDSGPLIGTTTSIPSATATVNQFLGIPFAAKPVRFSKPQRARRWTSPKNVSTVGPSCIQQFSGSGVVAQFTEAIFNDPPPKESEDCLFLNVFAPSGSPPKGGYPVLFWLYGGGLMFGNAGQSAYDGSYFAGFEDVIVVTTNYRTNVFGFPAAPELGLTEKNLGFYDQRHALEWVQRNIRAFKGDPKKVTIFGESAGALSVDALVTSYKHNAPFRAGILQSGQTSIRSRAGNSTGAWLSLAEKVNCTNPAATLECIRAVDALTLKKIISTNSLSFTPVADNVTLVSDPAARRARKEIANVPILSGSNAQEGRVFSVGQQNLTEYLATTFQVPALIQAINASYPRGQNGLLTDYDIISAIYTDLIFTCPGSKLVNASASAGYPTWRYFYTASFPNLNTVDRIGIDLQSFHSSEIPIVFSTYNNATSTPNGAPTTAQEVALSKYMRGAWADFARNPTNGPGWNRVGTFNETALGVLGWSGSSGVTVANFTVADSKCAVFEQLYNLAT